jgi:chromate transporter
VLYTSHYISRHRNSAAISGIMAGLRPITVGLIASAALLLMNGENFGTTEPHIIKSICICAAAFCAVYFAKIHPIFVIIAAGVVGFFIF